MKTITEHIRKFIGLPPIGDPYGYIDSPGYGKIIRSKAPEKWISTTCGYCSVGCGQFVGVRDDKIVMVRGDPDHPVNRGMLCPKGLTAHHALHSDARATSPLIRQSRKLVPASWDSALESFTSKVQAVQEKYGEESFAIISTGQLVTEELYALGKLARLGFKTKHYDGNTTLCMATAVSGYKLSLGSDGPPGAYEDFSKADCIILIGANIADNHPILLMHMMKNQGATVITVDPRVTKTAMLADMHLPIRPGQDRALLNGIMAHLISHDLVDDSFIENHTSGFNELKTSLADWSPERASKETGIETERIIRVANIIANAKSTVIAWTMGVNHSTQGTETVRAINTLAAITGNIGRVGGSPFSITGQCNAMGSREASATSSLPGYRKFEDENDRQELAKLWNVPVEAIPDQRGRAYPDIINAIIDGKIRGLWVIATNPVVSFPNRNLLEDALSRLDFLVVQDAFFPNPTAELADIFLPASMWGEKEGTFTNSERRVSKVNAAVSPPGQARSDFQIFMDIAERLNIKDVLYPGWKEPSDAFEEWKKVSAGRLCDYSGMTYDNIEKAGGIQWPCSELGSNGTKRLYTDGVVQTEDGRIKLHTSDCEKLPERPRAKSFPFILNTGRTVEHWHTRTKTANVPALDALVPEAWIEINPRDARDLGLRSHDRIRISTQRGFVEGVLVRITSTIASGHLFMPFHFAEQNANNLTLNVVDPISREPNFKQCAARIDLAS